jgi:uncharacterized protein involved in exopolysaccharide biosynthesis
MSDPGGRPSDPEGNAIDNGSPLGEHAGGRAGDPEGNGTERGEGTATHHHSPLVAGRPDGPGDASGGALADLEAAGARLAGELGWARLRGVVRRRRVPILATMVGATCVAALLLWRVPPIYQAQAVLRALEAQPPRDYVAPTVAEQVGERLKSLRLGVMARPLVAQAASELGMERDVPGVTRDELVDRLRERMEVRVEGADTFLLTYSDPDPERARALTNRVAELFVETQVARRQQIATATTEALRGEVTQLRPAVEAADQAVRAFKLERYGALPEQEEANLRTLDQTTMEINIQSTNLDTDLERRRQLLAAALSPLRHHEETLAGELYASRTKYTDDNAEVRRISAELERVRAQRLADERDLQAKVRLANPQLAALDGEIGRTKALLAGLRARQEHVRGRVQATAKNGQELAGLAATLDSLRGKYGAALGHLRDAELAESLERNLSHLRFDLVEGAALPSHAVAPDRTLLASAALLIALALGLGVGFFLDAQDRSVRGPAELRLLGAPPVLTCIPNLSARRRVLEEG